MHNYLKPLSESFSANADSEIAFFMKKYMKGQFAYFGIKSLLRGTIKAEFIREYGLPSLHELEFIVMECWELPQREYQYFIMELLERFAKKAPEERIILYEFMISNKSWWDTVDYIAANLVGVHFKKYPVMILPTTRKWMDTGNIWLQRTSLLFQLKYKNELDVILLSEYIQRLQGSKEFFINKAIGWILREYSKTNPEWVKEFVVKHPLAPLSKREALKWLEQKSQIIN